MRHLGNLKKKLFKLLFFILANLFYKKFNLLKYIASKRYYTYKLNKSRFFKNKKLKTSYY